MRFILVSFLCLSLLGCSGSSTGPSMTQTEYSALASGVVAEVLIFTDVEEVVPDDDDPAPSPGKCQTCNGRGYLIHGDGFRTDCPDCDSRYSPEAEAATEHGEPLAADPLPFTDGGEFFPVFTLVKFSTANCPPCYRFDRDELQSLRDVGYTEEIFQLVRVDQDPDLARSLGYSGEAFPCFKVLQDGKPIATRIGYTDGVTLSDWYNSQVRNWKKHPENTIEIQPVQSTAVPVAHDIGRAISESVSNQFMKEPTFLPAVEVPAGGLLDFIFSTLGGSFEPYPGVVLQVPAELVAVVKQSKPGVVDIGLSPGIKITARVDRPVLRLLSKSGTIEGLTLDRNERRASLRIKGLPDIDFTLTD